MHIACCMTLETNQSHFTSGYLTSKCLISRANVVFKYTCPFMLVYLLQALKTTVVPSLLPVYL